MTNDLEILFICLLTQYLLWSGYPFKAWKLLKKQTTIMPYRWSFIKRSDL